LIKKNPDGFYVKAEAVVKWKSLAVTDFQLAMLDLAKTSVETTPAGERSLSTVTLSISQRSIKKLKEKVKQFRAELLELVQQDEEIDRVFQICISAFPLTRTEKEPPK